MSNSNEWWTPDSLFESLCKKYKVIPELDVAATARNKKCPYWFSERDWNALERNWILPTEFPNGGRVVDIWLNEPTLKGLTEKFLTKAFEQWNRFGMNILGVAPAGVIARKYFQPIWKQFKLGNIDIDPIIPRPKFLFEGKETKWQARNDYISFLFKRKKPDYLQTSFEDHPEIVPLTNNIPDICKR